MRRVDDTPVFIRIVGDQKSFLCTVTHREGSSSAEEFVEIRQKFNLLPKKQMSGKGEANARPLESYFSRMVSSVSWKDFVAHLRSLPLSHLFSSIPSSLV